MLIRKPETQILRLAVTLSKKDYKRLDKVKSSAKEAGMDVDLEGSVARFICKLIANAEKELGLKGTATVNGVPVPNAVGSREPHSSI